MMQWFVNEVRGKFAELDQRIEGLAQMVKEPDSSLAERVSKLEGEIRMIKARAAKNKNDKEPGIDER